MVTKRTPIHREMSLRISPRAVEIFRQMEAPGTPADRWWRLNSDLSAELRLKPWEFPAYENPKAVCPHPSGHANRKWWEKRRPEGFELYRALMDAAHG